MMLFRLLISLVALAAPVFVTAEDGPSLQGEVTFESFERNEVPYEQHVTEARAVFSGLQDALPVLAKGESWKGNPTHDRALSWLATLYLYCSVQRGSCPLVLDAILEIDIAQASPAEATCPTMKRFWKQWIDLDLEKRQSFLMKTGGIQTAAEFSRSVRPTYIKCEERVADAMTESRRDRYQAGGAAAKRNDTMLAYIDRISSTIPNLYSEMGISFASPEKTEGKKKERRPKRDR